MLGFRSEAHVDAWCEETGLERRPSISLEQQWQLGIEWYKNRLTVESRRPGPEEMKAIFTALGLDDPFWDATSDLFGEQ